MKGVRVGESGIDVLAIGSAIVDVIAHTDDAFLAAEGLKKGGMRLIDAEEAVRLYGLMGLGHEISGGSAANTTAGIAALGRNAAFIGRIAADQLGEVFAHDIRAAGVRFETMPRGEEPPTARCLILVTPDAQRTMSTFLGAAQLLSVEDLDEELIRSAGTLYVEGYLWDAPTARDAVRRAIDIHRRAGGRVAFTLSDSFCVDRHRADFRALLVRNEVDVLFANEAEARSLYEVDALEAALGALAPLVPIAAVTRSEHGAVILDHGQRQVVPAEPVAQLVDTTGAGDLFAAGFLSGLAEGRPLADCGRIGAIAAAEVISHFGARPEADLKGLVQQRLG